MPLKKCVLVTDDPDDHQAFTDVVAENHPAMVVIVVMDNQKALELLREKNLLPEYLFLDISMHGIRINSFLTTLKNDEELKKIPIVIYGDESRLSYVDKSADILYFPKEYTYTELQDFLAKLF